MCGWQGHLEGPLWSCLSPSLLTGGAENVHFLGKKVAFPGHATSCRSAACPGEAGLWT